MAQRGINAASKELRTSGPRERVAIYSGLSAWVWGAHGCKGKHIERRITGRTGVDERAKNGYCHFRSSPLPKPPGIHVGPCLPAGTSAPVRTMSTMRTHGIRMASMQYEDASTLAATRRGSSLLTTARPKVTPAPSHGKSTRSYRRYAHTAAVKECGNERRESNDDQKSGPSNAT